MKLFMDTSAFLAVLNQNDQYHQPASRVWKKILSTDTQIFTSNYVLLETTALLQHRFGIDAMHFFEQTIRLVIEPIWVDQDLHRLGMGILLAANRRQLSLVDCTSFELMRQANIEYGFTFDPHFSEQGFQPIPGLGLA